ncbi:hypothetical protein C8Q74DRAFT_1374030 [Fomes fomentarius]|nr:hypothetical protein C8Q74DRAFT_1374030 [Fomes fomentarius]
MSNAAAILPIPALDNTYGALFLGAVFGFMLYGLTLHQTYRYFRMYQSDVLFLKCLVTIIVSLETLHTMLVIAACYYRLITNYFHPKTLLIGHYFYARRVWYVGPQYRYLVAVAGLIMLVILGFTISASVESFILSIQDFRHVSWMASALFGCVVLVDLLLTGTLITVLLRSRTGFSRTDSTIEVLVIYTINTGLFTSIIGLLGFIFAIILPGNFIYIGISIVGAKLYANSVLAVLNSRRSLSNRLLEGFEISSDDPQGGNQRPHTTLETWDASPQPRRTDTHISFATPSNAFSLDSSTAGAGGMSGSDRNGINKPDKQAINVLAVPRLDGKETYTI